LIGWFFASLIATIRYLVSFILCWVSNLISFFEIRSFTICFPEQIQKTIVKSSRDNKPGQPCSKTLSWFRLHWNHRVLSLQRAGPMKTLTTGTKISEQTEMIQPDTWLEMNNFLTAKKRHCRIGYSMIDWNFDSFLIRSKSSKCFWSFSIWRKCTREIKRKPSSFLKWSRNSMMKKDSTLGQIEMS
jgi:hypothetical protein